MTDSMVNFIEEHALIPPGSTVLCAVSGGADSIYLLHRLYRLRRSLPFMLIAAHFDHQLRGEESAQDAQFVQEFVTLCCGRDRVIHPDGSLEILPPVTLLTGSGDVAAHAKEAGRGIEETARTMRYQFLQAAAQQAGAQWIATAHTANDNGETILLHLARGTGLRGLCGMAPKYGTIIRPLLTTSREEIESYLRFWGLPWREDPSNREDIYARNRLRHRVLPELESLYPGLLARLADTAQRLRADEEFLTAQGEEALRRLEAAPDGTYTLPAEDLGHLPSSLAVRAARALLGRINQGDDRCTAAHLESLVDLCRTDHPSAQISLPGGLTARRVYGQLVLSRERPSPLPTLELSLPGQTQAGPWQISCSLELYGGQPQRPLDFYLNQRSIPALTVRSRQTGDRLTPPGRPAKTLKKWYIDEKIPRFLRDQLPVLECSGRLAGAAGLGPDAAFLPSLGAQAWHIRLLHPKIGEKTIKNAWF